MISPGKGLDELMEKPEGNKPGMLIPLFSLERDAWRDIGFVLTTLPVAWNVAEI